MLSVPDVSLAQPSTAEIEAELKLTLGVMININSAWSLLVLPVLVIYLQIGVIRDYHGDCVESGVRDWRNRPACLDCGAGGMACVRGQPPEEDDRVSRDSASHINGQSIGGKRDAAIGDFQEMKMPPSLERALRHFLDIDKHRQNHNTPTSGQLQRQIDGFWIRHLKVTAA